MSIALIGRLLKTCAQISLSFNPTGIYSVRSVFELGECLAYSFQVPAARSECRPESLNVCLASKVRRHLLDRRELDHHREYVSCRVFPLCLSDVQLREGIPSLGKGVWRHEKDEYVAPLDGSTDPLMVLIPRRQVVSVEEDVVPLCHQSEVDLVRCGSFS